MAAQRTKTRSQCLYPVGRGCRSEAAAVGSSKGPPKKKSWSEAKKDLGQIHFFDIFYGVFELPSPRNAQKRDKKQIDKKSV
jgi:hypothetical protein